MKMRGNRHTIGKCKYHKAFDKKKDQWNCELTDEIRAGRMTRGNEKQEWKQEVENEIKEFR